jgi:hypothetical protein
MFSSDYRDLTNIFRDMYVLVSFHQPYVFTSFQIAWTGAWSESDLLLPWIGT